MKIGDVVKVTDGSFSMEIGKQGLVGTGDLREKKYKIHGLDCDLPADTSRYCNKEKNNTIIIGEQSGRIVFIQERFLAIADSPKFCAYCGANLKSCDC